MLPGTASISWYSGDRFQVNFEAQYYIPSSLSKSRHFCVKGRVHVILQARFQVIALFFKQWFTHLQRNKLKKIWQIVENH